MQTQLVKYVESAGDFEAESLRESETKSVREFRTEPGR